MYLLAAFAGFALVLAAIGMLQRARLRAYGRPCAGIGIRMALGADARGVVRMVVADALRPTLVGIVVGLAVAMALRRVIASLLFGVSPGDPATFGGVAVLLVAMALAAARCPRTGRRRSIQTSP